MMKIKDVDGYCNLDTSNCKNTRTENYSKKVRCVCGCTRMEVEVCVEGEGAGEWIQIHCKKCNRNLYSNGA